MRRELLEWMDCLGNLVFTVERVKNISRKMLIKLWYRESKDGVVEEGINEAGAFSAWIALATSYANSLPMIPFILLLYVGFQRVHDLAWAAGDARARGFLLGTAGRTTLNGEGLQHQDGHSTC